MNHIQLTDKYNNNMQTISENFDPLLECLLHLCKSYDISTSREGLRAGLPLENNKLTPSLFVRAAESIDLNAKIIKRPLKKISNLLTPLVLILHDNTAGILQKINDDNTYDLLLPELDNLVLQKTFEQLEKMYTGYAILVQPIKMKEAEKLTVHPSSWFWGTIWHFKDSYVQVMLAAFFINLFTLASPLFIMNVYDRVVPNNANITLWVLSIGICIIFLFDIVLRFLRSYLIDVCGKKADTLMAGYIFQHIMNMALIHKPKSIGAFVNHIRDFESVRDFFTSATIIGFIDVPFILLFIFFIWYLGSYLVFIPLVTIPIMVLISWLAIKPTQKYITQTTQAAAQKNAILIESLTGIEIIKSLVAEGILQRRWEKINGIINSASIKAKTIANSTGNLTNFLQQLTTVLIVIGGVYLIENHMMTLGGLIACSILNGRTLAPISQLISMISRYQQAKLSLKHIETIMAMPTERSDTKEYIQHHDIKGDILFSEVSFLYPEQEHLALNHINLKISQGERVGIIGRIGSGKTTLQKLILTLYQPKEGQITLDGIDITQLDPANLRKQIGYAPQDPSLFSGTLRDNILLGNSEVSDDHLIEIAKLTGAEKIAKLSSSGFHLKLGDRGDGLSGGQKQSIALARALIGHPQIILFDEPTSSMDDQSEKEFIVNLSEYIKGKTFIVSTHKALLLTLVDRIIVLDHGKIVFDGPKDKILMQAKKT